MGPKRDLSDKDVSTNDSDVSFNPAKAPAKKRARVVAVAKPANIKAGMRKSDKKPSASSQQAGAAFASTAAQKTSVKKPANKKPTARKRAAANGQGATTDIPAAKKPKKSAQSSGDEEEGKVRPLAATVADGSDEDDDDAPPPPGSWMERRRASERRTLTARADPDLEPLVSAPPEMLQAVAELELEEARSHPCTFARDETFCRLAFEDFMPEEVPPGFEDGDFMTHVPDVTPYSPPVNLHLETLRKAQERRVDMASAARAAAVVGAIFVHTTCPVLPAPPVLRSLRGMPMLNLRRKLAALKEEAGEQ